MDFSPLPGFEQLLDQQFITDPVADYWAGLTNWHDQGVPDLVSPIPDLSLTPSFFPLYQDSLQIYEDASKGAFKPAIDTSAIEMTSISSDPFPGELSFHIAIDSGNKKQLVMSDNGKVLIVSKDENVAIKFLSSSALPATGFIRAIVMYTEFEYTRLRGKVTSCSKDTRVDCVLGNRFMQCNSYGSICTEYQGHHAIVLPVAQLSRVAEEVFAVFSFRCLSSHLSENIKRIKSPQLTLLFQLLDSSGTIIGIDSTQLRVSLQVNRDVKKLLTTQSGEEAPPAAKKCRRQSTSSSVDTVPPSLAEPLVHPLLDFSDNAETDKDGNYHFTWKGKDKIVFNILTLIKMSSDCN